MNYTVYKLTDKNGQTYGGCQWGPNVCRKTDGKGELCGAGWTHFYLTPELAVLLNPIHGNYTNPRLWEAKRGRTVKMDHQLKGGTAKLTTIREISLPECTTEIRVRFAILCAIAVRPNEPAPQYMRWAKGWLEGTNRTAAEAAAAEAWAAAAAEEEAAAAAWAAAAAEEEEAAAAARAAAAAAARAWAAAAARAWAAAAARAAAARAHKPLDLVLIARQAFDLSYIPEIVIPDEVSK